LLACAASTRRGTVIILVCEILRQTLMEVLSMSSVLVLIRPLFPSRICSYRPGLVKRR
jgi:hypothetical protein